MDKWERLLGEAQAAAKAAREVAETAKADGDRALSDEERETFDTKSTEAVSKKEESDKAKADADRMKSVMSLSSAEQDEKRQGDTEVKSLGEHFVKSAGDRLKSRDQRFSVSSPEFKANTDTQVTGGPSGAWGEVLTQVDRNVVQDVRRRLTIADLLGSGTLSGQAITYFVEGALQGDFTTVAEGGAKPQIHFADPSKVTESLSKIAGFIKESDEMTEDLPFVVSAINNRLLYQLGLFEENQLLSGDGTGTNLQGILGRGIQSEASASAADDADAIFRAMTKVSTGSGLDADAIVINPMDYQALRLKRDANEQYYGGGYFAGQYGANGMPMQPPLWGLRTVVTPAVAAKTVLVGSFAQAATLYRKGGVRVEMTNSNEDDFTNNLVTIRAEERLALAVRKPAGFVNTTLFSAV